MQGKLTLTTEAMTNPHLVGYVPTVKVEAENLTIPNILMVLIKTYCDIVGNATQLPLDGMTPLVMEYHQNTRKLIMELNEELRTGIQAARKLGFDDEQGFQRTNS